MLGYPKPLTEPDPLLAVELSALEAPFNPEFSGVPPSYNNLHVETPHIPRLGVDFDPFLWSLLDCICLSPFQLSEKKLPSVCDPFRKETLCEWNLRCELNS